MKRRSFIAGLATTAVVATLSACGSSSTATSASSARRRGGQGRHPQHPVRHGHVEHWDPQRVYVGVNIEYGNRMFTRTLVSWSAVTSTTPSSCQDRSPTWRPTPAR